MAHLEPIYCLTSFVWVQGRCPSMPEFLLIHPSFSELPMPQALYESPIISSSRATILPLFSQAHWVPGCLQSLNYHSFSLTDQMTLPIHGSYEF